MIAILTGNGAETETRDLFGAFAQFNKKPRRFGSHDFLSPAANS